MHSWLWGLPTLHCVQEKQQLLHAWLHACPWLEMSPEISYTPIEERGQVASRDLSPEGQAFHLCLVLWGSRRGALKLCSPFQPHAPWRWLLLTL